MRMYHIIERKKLGEELSAEEIRFFIKGYVTGEIPDYQISALLMAICFQGMTPEETVNLTLAMADSGEKADLSTIPGIKVDKHSTGGVGDKTTLVVAPIVASQGVPVAKMSGRGLGHTGGTIDKLMSIPGMQTSISREHFLEIVRKVGLSIISQSGNLVPADKKLYALRDVTATVDSIPLIASSIMSKKIASGADCILLDVKTGSGAFMKTVSDSLKLAQTMVTIGEKVGRKTVALVTDMDQPLGRTIGNSLEVTEACRTLQGKGPVDLTELCTELAAGMLFLAEKGKMESCRAMAKSSISSGSAFAKLKEMVKAQGGDPSVLDDPQKFEQPKEKCNVTAPTSGYLYAVDAEQCGIASMELGAGRKTKDDAIDYAAGITLFKKKGDFVRAGETLAVFASSSDELCKTARKTFLNAIKIRGKKPACHPLILARVSKKGVQRFQT